MNEANRVKFKNKISWWSNGGQIDAIGGSISLADRPNVLREIGGRY